MPNNFKKNNPNYRNINDPKPLSNNPATPKGYENTYNEYDKDNPRGKPVRQWDPKKTNHPAMKPPKIKKKK
jgi:hypothetical protein